MKLCDVWMEKGVYEVMVRRDDKKMIGVLVCGDMGRNV